MKQHSNGKVSETTSGEEAIELWFARTPFYFHSGKNPFLFQKHLIHYSSSHLYVCRPVLQHSESLTRTLSAIDQLRHEFPILRKWRQILTYLIPRLANILVCFERILSVCSVSFYRAYHRYIRCPTFRVFLGVKKPYIPLFNCQFQ